MRDTTPRIPVMVTFMAGCFIFLSIVFVNVNAQSSTPESATASADAISISRDVFLWLVAAAGFVSLFVSIGYGFFKKQKYDNIEKDRDEWKDLAEGREERIKELKHTQTEAEARQKLVVNERDTEIRNLRMSNDALVSMCLQIKAILKEQRLAGLWQGHEDRIHETKRDE